MTAAPAPDPSARTSRGTEHGGAVLALRPTERARRDHPAGGGRARRPRRRAPDAARLAETIVRAHEEVAIGRRPFDQLRPVLAPALLSRLAVRLRHADRRAGGEPPRVHRVHLAPPTPTGAVEATVLLDHGERLTAVAVRLERHLGAWRATELTAPEAGYAPLTTASQADGARRRDAFDEVAEEAATDAALRRRGSA